LNDASQFCYFYISISRFILQNVALSRRYSCLFLIFNKYALKKRGRSC